MAIFALANFTAADGTALTSYTADTGTLSKSSWSAAGVPVIVSNRARAGVSSENESWFFGASPDADQPNTTVLRKVSGNGLVDIYVRGSTSQNTGYVARWFTGNYFLYRVVNGSYTELGAAVASSWTDGTSKTLILKAVTNGSQVDVTLHVDGVQVRSESDSSGSRITSTGSIGFNFFETATPGSAAGFHIDSIQGGIDPPFAITSPVQYQVFQRGSGGLADIAISGTCGDAATGIEASWNGGAYQTIDSSIVGNAFSGTLTSQPAGQGTLTVRYTNVPATTTTVANVGVGEIFAVAGQSNASGRGTNNQTYSHATLKACLFGNDYLWHELSDPTDESSGQVDVVSDDTNGEGGSFWPKCATDLMAALGVPVAFVPCAMGSTSITAWLPGVNHLNRGTLYGSMNYRIQQVGGVRAVLWYQGEGDALAAMSQATYNGHLDTLANAIASDASTVLVAGLIHHSTGNNLADEVVINAAITEAAGDNANVRLGADLSDQTSDDSFHLQTDGKLTTAGARWAAALLNSGLFSPIPVFMAHYRMQGIA